MYKLKVIVVMMLVLFFFASSSWAAEIHDAALKGDAAKVKELLKSDPGLLNSEGSNQKKPIHFAAQGGHKELVEYLLSQGAAVDTLNIAKETPLHYVAELGFNDIVELLIAKGANLNARAKFGPPLVYAAMGGKFDTIKLLISKGADVKVPSEGNLTVLHRAAFSGSGEMAELLISKGIPADAKNDDGLTPLHFAIMGSNLETTKVLIQKGADVNSISKGEWEFIPLYQAVEEGNKDIVALLLTSGASVDVKKKQNGQTPLHLAAIKGYGEIASMLLDKGANPDAVYAGGNTPIYYAARYAHKKVAKVLISKGVKIHDPDKMKESFGFSPLLKKEFNPGDSLVWYLGHSGWAVKTQNHLLIFDYFPPKELPDTPLMANGSINPEEIKDLHVTVFSSHAHGDHFAPSILDWKKDVKNIAYIIGFKPEVQADYVYMGPGESKTIDGMDIVTIKSNDSGVGFFVRVDGVNVFHSGDHANRTRDFSGPFKEEIDFLASKDLKPDVYFAPVSGCGFGDPESVKLGVYYTIKKLSPKVIFPMHALGNEPVYMEFAEKAKKEGIGSSFGCAGNKGDWFFIRGGGVKKTSVACSKKEEKVN